MDTAETDGDRRDDFERHRSRLLGVAYRMLASRAEAEDVVQEAYLRWHRADGASIREPEAWLVTTATRLAIDRLRALKIQREAYVGPWLPEVFLGHEPPPPDRDVELASDLSVAFVVLLERLAAEERAAFLLHDVFDCDYAEIARTLDKSEATCRQIVHRARERVKSERRRFRATEGARVGLLRRFNAAVEARDGRALVCARRHLDRRRGRPRPGRPQGHRRGRAYRPAPPRAREPLRGPAHPAPGRRERRDGASAPGRRPASLRQAPMYSV